MPGDSWVNDPVEGAGRIVGEVCHFVDLAQYLTGSQLVRAYAETIRGNNGGSHQEENLAITLSFQDGSLASIVYTAVGDRAFPRERVELFWDESVCLIDNFKSMTFTRRGKGSRMKKWNVDRGHHGEMKPFSMPSKRGLQWLYLSGIMYILLLQPSASRRLSNWVNRWKSSQAGGVWTFKTMPIIL